MPAFGIGIGLVITATPRIQVGNP